MNKIDFDKVFLIEKSSIKIFIAFKFNQIAVIFNFLSTFFLTEVIDLKFCYKFTGNLNILGGDFL